MTGNWKRISVGGGILALLVILPLITTRSDILTWSCLTLQYILLSQSWNIIGGYAGQVNLGHAAFFGLGALTTRYLWLSALPLPFALLAGALMATAFALLIGIPAFRLRGIYFVIGTLVLAEILKVVVDTRLPVASVLPAPILATYSVVPRYYISLIGAVLAVATVYGIHHSKLGLGLIAIRENEDAAKTSGVNILKYKLVALAISTFPAGLAGGIFAFYMIAIQPGYVFAPVWTFDPVIIVFIGGIGTIIGPLIGSIFFVLLKQWMSLYLPGGFHLAVFGVLFIVVVLYLPNGLVEVIRRHTKLIKTFG
ncbi:MAG: branched-chain amino acid ABC transporter permease [Thermodesulfobacteriota bacterium]